MKDGRGSEKSKKRNDSYFAISRLRRKRYMMIIIPIIAAIAIGLGLLFSIGSQQHGLGAKLVMHIHPRLNVTVDGNSITVPQNIGIDESLWKDHSLDKYGVQGAAPLHTHDTSGTIHVESNVVRNYTLGEFLNIWGGIDFNNKTVKTTIDGKPVSTDFRNIILRDGEQIKLEVNR
jgi:hypothetical protein